MSNEDQSLVGIFDKIWQIQIDILELFKIDVFFIERGWPFVILFFVYGAIFPPLAILYALVGLVSAERYFSKIRQKEHDVWRAEMKSMDDNNNV